MNNDKTIAVDLLKTGVSNRTGLDYTKAFEELDVDWLNNQRRTMYGEFSMPKIDFSIKGMQPKNILVREDSERRSGLTDDRDNMAVVSRVIQIDLGNVSHSLHNLRKVDGVLKADVKPCGPNAKILEAFHKEGRLHFGMRGFVELEEDGKTVKKIRSIVTFDLVSTPL